MKPEEFAARRRADLAVADERLGAIVARALQSRTGAWYAPIVDEAGRIWLEHFQAEAPGANFLPALGRFRAALADSLERTSDPTSSDRVTRFVSTFSVNAGTINGAAQRGITHKRWTTMHDGEVRDLHAPMDGQIKPIGGLFDLGIAKLPYPGVPSGPPEAWIECRCVAQPASREGETMSGTTFALGPNDAFADDEVPIANPDGTPYTGALVVLLPAKDDPVVAASAEPAHVTTVWFGEAADLPVDAEELEQAVRLYAQDLDGPLIVPVSQRGTLGDDDADVVFLEPTDSLLALRDGLLANEPVKTAYDAADQFPEWTPHVTLGYPDRPARGEYDGTEITFDRIGLWLGGEHFEYQMGGTAVSASAAFADQSDLTEAPTEVAPDDVDEDEDDDEDVTEIPVHGVLAPEGVLTGDGRGFREGALSTRPLPVPLRLEIVGTHGGNTSDVVTVGRVDEAWRDEERKQMRFRGAIIVSKEHAARAIEGIIDGSGTGVSIDADDMAVDIEAFEADSEAAMKEGRTPPTWFKEARVAGLTIVPIPAFHEAYIALGHEFEEDMTDEDREAAREALAACGCASEGPDGFTVEDLTDDQMESFRAAAEVEDGAYRQYDADARKRMAENGQALPDGSFPIADEEDLKNAIQAIGRASDPEAARAHIKKRAKALGKEALIPEGWALATGGIIPAGTMALVGAQDPEYIVPVTRNRELIAALAQSNVAFDSTGLDPRFDYSGLERGDRAYFGTDLAHAPADVKARIEAWEARVFAPGTKDGPGWITNPVATARIRRYWVRGEGAAKIRWGVPGDFNRCRRQLVKYVQNPDWLAGLCANMHKEALGFWPGEHRGNRGRHALIASGAAVAPIMTLIQPDEEKVVFPDEWFEDPKFSKLTPMTIDKETGRIYGHLAQWGVCHIGIAGACVDPPRSRSNYAAFLRGVVDTTKGERRVGCLTYGTGHARPELRLSAATAHYDQTDAVFAFVGIGEDRFGIWYSGVIRPLTPERIIDDVRAIGALSGDWRYITRHGLELVGAVTVNGPGYPVIAASGGVQTTLILGNVEPEVSQAGTEGFSDENEEWVARIAARTLRMVKDEERKSAARSRLVALRNEEARRALRERI